MFLDVENEYEWASFQISGVLVGIMPRSSGYHEAQVPMGPIWTHMGRAHNMGPGPHGPGDSDGDGDGSGDDGTLPASPTPNQRAQGENIP